MSSYYDTTTADTLQSIKGYRPKGTILLVSGEWFQLQIISRCKNHEVVTFANLKSVNIMYAEKYIRRIKKPLGPFSVPRHSEEKCLAIGNLLRTVHKTTYIAYDDEKITEYVRPVISIINFLS